jgi:serine/threonine-protein kinase
MSPEQALGREDIDHRSDVWALCVVIYESITGKVPWDQPNYNALMQAIIHEKPAPTTDFSAGDADLWRVIERGLQKNPENRWASMTELGEALALWLYEHGVKEDISANSLRAVWLDGSLSGVRMEFGSMMPNQSQSNIPHGETGPRLVTHRPQLKSAPAPSTTVSTIPPARAPRRWLIPSLVGVALLLGLGTGLLLRSSKSAEPTPTQPQSTPLATVVAREPTPAPSAAPVEPSAAPAPAASAPKSKAAAPAAAKPSTGTGRARPAGKRYDFGF